MPKNIIMRARMPIFILSTLILLAGYAQYKRDPFSPYRDFIKKPLSIKPKELKHYSEEEQLIRTALKLNLSSREKSILAGIHWIITLADDDDNFSFLFPDLMLLMHRMTMSEDRGHQRQIAQSVVKKSFARAEKSLADLFSPDEQGRWGLIRLFPILIEYPQFSDNYFQFYQSRYASSLRDSFKPNDMEFTDALKLKDYQIIFAYLLETSLLHYYLIKAKDSQVPVPSDRFPEYMKAFENFNYPTESEDSRFRDVGYLATHIILYLTNYGEFPIKPDVNQQKTKEYIESTFERVEQQLGDFDLFAEYILCLKILNPKKDSRIKELEQFLFDLQRPDGSWGSKRDFKTNPYTAIHPTGAALFALNQSNR